MNLPVLVGDRIRELRKAKGWTQEQLAEASSLHYSYIGGVERGDRNISLETLEKIVLGLQIQPLELFRFNFELNGELKERQEAIDEHMVLISHRSTEEIQLITKINRDILKAIDLKQEPNK